MRIFVLAIIFVFVLLPSVAATRRALIIGISMYPDNKTANDESWGAIHGANDIKIIKQTLKVQGFKIATLTNKKATVSNIRRALSKLQFETKTGDFLSSLLYRFVLEAWNKFEFDN